jgi:hypothetical protein
MFPLTSGPEQNLALGCFEHRLLTSIVPAWVTAEEWAGIRAARSVARHGRRVNSPPDTHRSLHEGDAKEASLDRTGSVGIFSFGDLKVSTFVQILPGMTNLLGETRSHVRSFHPVWLGISPKFSAG